MEALKDQPHAEGIALSSAQVVSKVLPKNSCNIFLKNIGLQPTSPTKPPTTKERALQEQLAAEKQASTLLQDEVNVRKENFQNTEEALQRTQMELQEYKKAMEENKKAVEENNLLLKRLLQFNCGRNLPGPSS
jgi:molecular chaperone GrpE (heat shock protein)